MRKYLALLLLLVSPLAWAPPFIISDPLAIGVNQCGVFVDSNPKRVIPVTAVTTPVAGNICKLDLFDFTVGSHAVTMTAIINDPVWGSQESVQSSPPLALVRPATPSGPSGLRLTP